MKCTREGHVLRFSGLPSRVEGIKTPAELTVEVVYLPESGVTPLRAALCLDNVILPAIVAAINRSEEGGGTES